MQSLIHADIFFFVTTIVVVAVALVLIVILIYIAVILSDIKKLSRIIRDEGAGIADDVRAFREEVKEEARHSMRNSPSTAAAILGIIATLFAHRKKKPSRSAE